MRVLITGAAGFIGSNLAKRCLNEGWTVSGVDDLSNGRLEFVTKGVKFYRASFTAKHVIRSIQNKEYDVVFHLAAIPRVSYSVEHLVETNHTNVTETLKLLEACKGNVKRVVFASSSSVYGGAEKLPTHELTPRSPKSPYALQKAVIEDYLKLYSELYGMDSASMRFFNVFGANQLGNSPYATALSAWMTAIKMGLPMRSDGDGTQSRDLCHVDNVTHACVLAAKFEGTLGADVFNVACGDRTSNNEILEHLMKLYPDAKRIDAPWRAGDVMHTQADIRKIETVLGYTVQTRVWEGVEKTVKWYEDCWSQIQKMQLRT